MFNQLITTFLRVFFRLLYGPFAWSYDWVSAVVSLGRWQDWVLTLLDELQGERILELGFGPGHLQLAALNRGWTIIGLELSPQMVRQAASRIKKFGKEPMLVNGYAQYMPFATGSFQQVVATFPSDYFYQETTLNQIHRVLTLGGELWVLPMAWISGQNILDRSARALFTITHQAPPHMDPLIDRQFLSRLKQAGFKAHSFRRKHSSSEVLLIKGIKVQFNHGNTDRRR